MQTMKAWQLDGLGGALAYTEVAVPEPRPGAVVVKIACSSLLSYQRDYITGKLPHYSPPTGPFTIGTNAVGTIHAVGRDVWHLHPGQRVVVSPHFTATENVVDPAQLLIGLTAYGDGKRVQADWRDGTLADYVMVPAATVTRADGLDDLPATELITSTRHLVPYGGLLRGRLAAGETVLVTGATGTFGGAAVLVALAMGAGKVIGAGRNREALAELARVAGPRFAPIALTGEVERDVVALRTAGPIQLAFDMVGRATDPNMTLAALRALQRGGRLVLMGSMTVPLPIPYGEVMLGNLEILGQFMYPPDAYRRLLDLVRANLLDLSKTRARVFPIADLPAALDAAADAASLECVIIDHTRA